ncbi:hypothetical protein [Paenibacillus contaminans]|uniref:Uncharacterized protein n=1 Tax=Paenibacillus contaminans TaxID=450362 RepID=A0A329MPS1_9BACL|nr:hypothetical protein [Paenibacillus contaminans]RAV21286.1 hypothetical protein DQG23_11550 [Paenibacillus contaminans]
MNPVILIGMAGVICGVLQLLFPDYIYKLGLLGIRSREAVKKGAIPTIVAGVCFILFGLFKEK